MNRKNMVEEKLPFSRNLLFALQHIFVMVAGAVAVPMIVGGATNSQGSVVDITYLISCALFAAGIATVLQTIGIGKFMGAKIAVIEGTSFASVSAMREIAKNAASGGNPLEGLGTIAVAVIVAGLFCFLFSGVWGKLLKFFPPLVTGTVVTVIGISLFPIGIRWIAEVPRADAGTPLYNFLHGVSETGTLFPDVVPPLLGNLALAGLSLLLVIVFSKFLKGVWNSLAVLLAIVGGTVIAIIRDLLSPNALYNWINLDPIKNANWLGLPVPFHVRSAIDGTLLKVSPHFSISAIISFLLIMLVIMTEATGNMIAVHNMSGKEIDPKNLTRGLRSSGISTMISGGFNSYPVTPFAQNVGMLGMTGVFSRFVTATAGILLVALGFFPKFAAAFAAIPKPVLGGAGFAMFGMVAIGGIRTLGKVNFNGNKNALIVAISIGVSMIPTVAGDFFSRLGVEAGYILHSGITLGCIAAIVLNIFFNMVWVPKEQKEAEAAFEAKEKQTK